MKYRPKKFVGFCLKKLSFIFFVNICRSTKLYIRIFSVFYCFKSVTFFWLSCCYCVQTALTERTSFIARRTDVNLFEVITFKSWYRNKKGGLISSVLFPEVKILINFSLEILIIYKLGNLWQNFDDKVFERQMYIKITYPGSEC